MTSVARHAGAAVGDRWVRLTSTTVAVNQTAAQSGSSDEPEWFVG
jgi:hypothetical protein